MDRTYEAAAAASPPSPPASPSSGYPTNGDPVTAVPATRPGEYWYHMVVEELRAILSNAGVTPDHTVLTQLATAIQAGTLGRASATGGTVDAITATFAPAVPALINGMIVEVRATGANTVTNPTFTPNSGTIAVKTITRENGATLLVGDTDIGHWMRLRYESGSDKWVLMNPLLAPTTAQFDADNSPASTEFVQRALGNMRGFQAVTTSTAIPAAEVGKFYQIGGATASGQTFTLPLAATPAIGSVLAIQNASSYKQTIACSGADVISGVGASITIWPGETIGFLAQGAGAWDAVNDAIATCFSKSFDLGQTWTGVGGSRVLGTVYTNSTGRPIEVFVSVSSTAAAYITVTVGGVTGAGSGGAIGERLGASFTVPDGVSYSVNVSAGTGSIGAWLELR